jgi:L-lactate permease
MTQAISTSGVPAPTAIENAAAVLAAAQEAGGLAANVVAVNEIAVQGTGTDLDPWGP